MRQHLNRNPYRRGYIGVDIGYIDRLIVCFHEQSFGRPCSSHRLGSMPLPKRQTEPRPQQLFCQCTLSAKAVHDPRLCRTQSFPHVEQFAPRPHTMDNHRFTHRFCQFHLRLEQCHLSLHWRPYKSVEPSLPYHNDLWMDGSAAQHGQSLFISVPRVYPDGVHPAWLRLERLAGVYTDHGRCRLFGRRAVSVDVAADHGHGTGS